jgi:hypothetical protein
MPAFTNEHTEREILPMCACWQQQQQQQQLHGTGMVQGPCMHPSNQEGELSSISSQVLRTCSVSSPMGCSGCVSWLAGCAAWLGASPAESFPNARGTNRFKLGLMFKDGVIAGLRTSNGRLRAYPRACRTVLLFTRLDASIMVAQ